MAEEGWNEASKSTLLEQYEPQMMQAVMGMYQKDPLVQKYYYNMIRNTIYPSVEMQSLAIDEEG